MEYEIKQNKDKSRFEVICEDRVIGLVDYELVENKNQLIVPHTEVSSEFEGQGIAATLTKRLLDYAADNRLEVLPLCSYTRSYIERHPEYQILLSK